MEQDNSSKSYSFLEYLIIDLWLLGFGGGVFGFWALDKFWGRIVTDSMIMANDVHTA